MAFVAHTRSWIALSGAVAGGLVTVLLASGGQGETGQAPAGAAPQARAHATCEPSITRPGVYLNGRVIPRGSRSLGDGPILAGPFRGPRAVLHVFEGDDGIGSKFYYLLDPAGPARASVIVRRLDGPGGGLFEVHRTDEGGRFVRRFVRVLRLNKDRVRRENPPRRGDRWLGQPGSVRLPALGCYQLQVRWSAGGWSKTFSARPDPRLRR